MREEVVVEVKDGDVEVGELFEDLGLDVVIEHDLWAGENKGVRAIRAAEFGADEFGEETDIGLFVGEASDIDAAELNFSESFAQGGEVDAFSVFLFVEDFLFLHAEGDEGEAGDAAE